MGLDEKAFAPMNKSKINAAMNREMIPRHPQILVIEPQIVDLVISQAVVFRQDNFDTVATDFQLSTQTENHVAQSPHLGHRGALRCEHYDIHSLDWMLSGAAFSSKRAARSGA